MMPAGVMIRSRPPGQRREVGQLRQRDVHAKRAGAAAPAADALAKILRQHRGVDQRAVQQLRIQVGYDAARPDRLAVRGDHAHGAAAFDQNFAHRTRDSNVDAARRRRLRHRLRDGAHAADRMSPRAFLAVDLAEHVVQQHVGGTRRSKDSRSCRRCRRNHRPP